MAANGSALFELLGKVWSRDGLWALIALLLIVYVGYLHGVKIQGIEEVVHRIEFKQMRDCIRSLKPKSDPAICWTDPPHDVIDKALTR